MPLNGNGRHWTESFRVFTPILITIAIFMLGQVIATTNKIDDKLFKHLTNDELHSPRSMIINKAEFNMYKEMLDRQVQQILRAIEKRDNRDVYSNLR